MKSFYGFTLASLLAVTASPAAFSDVVSEKLDSIDQLLIVEAPSASMEAVANKEAFVISLEPEAIRLLGISPRAFVSQIPADDLLHAWRGIFESHAKMPALLRWVDETGAVGVRVQIEEPSYDAENNALRFTVHKTAKTSNTLESLSVRKRPPAKLKAGVLTGVQLYLDDAQGEVAWYAQDNAEMPGTVAGKVVGGCVFQPYTQCEGAFLEKADLTGIDLTGANFARANLTQATLNNTTLTRANLGNVGLYNAVVSASNFDYADLSYANLGYGQWSNVALRNTNLRNAKINDMTLTNVTFCHVTMPDGSINDSGCGEPTPTPVPTPTPTPVPTPTPIPTTTVTVWIAGPGTGYVTSSSDSGFWCRNTSGKCALQVRTGTPVTLTAHPGSRTDSTWESGCDAQDKYTCLITPKNSVQTVVLKLFIRL